MNRTTPNIADYRYISLKDLLKDQPIPKLKVGGATAESEEEPDLPDMSGNLFTQNPMENFPPPNSAENTNKTHRLDDKEKNEKRCTKVNRECAMTKGSRSRRSRSDEPLIYEDFGRGGGEEFLSEAICKRSVSWEAKRFNDLLFEEKGVVLEGTDGKEGN